MKMHIIAPSGTGKSTSHDKRLLYDVESHLEYQKRKQHYDWNSGDTKLKDIRVDYWHAFTRAALDSNFPTVTTHHSLEMIEHSEGRKIVCIYKQPNWDLVGNEKEWNRSRLVALSMNLASMLGDTNDFPIAEGYVTDLCNELNIQPVSQDEWILNEDRLYEGEHNAAIHALDEKYGYEGGVVIA